MPSVKDQYCFLRKDNDFAECPADVADNNVYNNNPIYIGLAPCAELQLTCFVLSISYAVAYTVYTISEMHDMCACSRPQAAKYSLALTLTKSSVI